MDWNAYLYGDDDDSSVQFRKNNIVHNFYAVRNACVYFYHAAFLQYDFTGSSVLCFSWTRNNVQIELTGGEFDGR